jgi:recombination protein U
MATWGSRGLRGATLEQMINATNEKYRQNNMALVNKIPTPITPIRIDKATRHITLAYFGEKSTVDYIGAVQGYPVCFDAKECASNRFSLQNIHSHQLQYMEEFEQQGGIAFFLLYFTSREKFYYLTLREARYHINLANEGGLKAIKYEELDEDYFIPLEKQVYINYLKILQKDIDGRI